MLHGHLVGRSKTWLEINIIILCILGTRIIYERKFLLDLKSSPLSQTPTKLPVIPGVTLDDNGKIIEEDESALDTLAEESTKQAKVEEKKNAGIFLTFFILSFFPLFFLRL